MSDASREETVTFKDMLDVLGEAFTDEELPTIMESLIERAAEDGYTPDTLIHGRDPRHTLVVPTAEDVERGDLVEIDSAGRARRAGDGRIIGVALGDGRVRLTAARERFPDGIEMSWARPVGSMMYHASIAYGARNIWAPETGGPGRFQFNERFPKEVVDKAMKLLEKFMSPDQYEAFLRGDRVELENKKEDHRIMISRTGDFTILRGPRGAGIVMTSGRCRSYKYPLGDEIAAFLDWFNHRTEELIDRWKCGTFGIIEEGKGR